MKINKPPVKKPASLNVSIHREVLDATQDLLNALIVEHIYYRFNKNDKKPVWLKINWIREKLPYISRSGLAKKLKKLVKDGHIIVKRGEGRYYHKCWYSLSADMREACSGEGIEARKVYYNPDIAEKHLEASVIYAAIVNLLKVEEYPLKKLKGSKIKVGSQYGRVENKLLLDYQKLAEGSGLSLSKIRKAVNWLIDNKKIEAKNVFGNKRLVWLPSDTTVTPAGDELLTESYPHAATEGEDPTEY